MHLQVISTVGGVRIIDTTKKQITLSYSQITNEYIAQHGKECLLVLALILRRYNIRHEVSFNFKYLYDKLNIKPNRKEQKNKIIECINKIFKTNFSFDVDINQIIDLPYEIQKEQYLIVADDEVDTILNYNKSINKYNLFNVYVVIKRHINYYSETSYVPIKTIMDITNIKSNNSVVKHIKTLEELNLIGCERGEYFATDEGIRKLNNTYTLKQNYKNI